MSSCVLHRDAVGHAFSALEPDEDRALRDHLPHCPACRRTLDAARGVAVALGAAVPAGEPPPDLRDRVLAAARAEAGPPVRPLAVVPGAGRGDVPGPSRPARGHRRRPLIATGGFAAAVVVGIGLVVARGVVATRAEPPATPAVALAQQADRVVADARSRDPGLRAAVLRTGTGDPAAVVLDPGDAAAPLRLLPLALPPAGTARDYVVWAVGLPGDVPVAVAVMDPDEGLTRPLAVTAAPSAPGAPEARGWAVSVEADGPAPARPSAVVAVGLAVA